MRKFTMILLALFVAANFSFGQMASYQKTGNKQSKDLSFQTKEQKIAYDEANSPMRSVTPQEDYPDMNSPSRGDMIFEEYFDSDLGSMTNNVFSGTGQWEWTGSIPWWAWSGLPVENPGYAMCDSDGHSGVYYDVGLETPVLDVSAYTRFSVECDLNFEDLGGQDYAGIFIGNPTDGWTLLWEADGVDVDGEHEYFEIETATLPADPTNIQLAFYYYTGGDWQWGFLLDNIVVQEIDPSIEGYVLNSSGQTIAGATVEVTTLGRTATTNATGYYQFFGIADGDYEMVAYRTGYNTSDPVTVTVTAPNVTYQEFTLLNPEITVSPLIFDETLHPNEYLTTYLGLLNTGSGPWNWTAWITYPPAPMRNYPHYGLDMPQIEYGQMNDANAFSRVDAGDVVLNAGSRAVGDVLEQYSISGLSMTWGAGFDGTYLYLTDPVGATSTIYQFNTDGTATGTTFNVSVGQSWIGDLASDGTYLYALMVGGPNNIQVIDIATGTVVNTIGNSSWTYTSQRGLAYDPLADEFYVGGWNDYNIYRIDNTGAVLSTYYFGAVSGLEWHPQGGPGGTGSLWVMTNASPSVCTELDPNDGWANLQSFNQPGNNSYGGCGLALNSDGNLWMPNMNENIVYLVDTEEPLSGGGATGWLTLDTYDGTIEGGGGSFNIGVNFNASGTVAGEVYHADIFINSSPNVGLVDVPVTMTIGGDEFPLLDGFTATLTDEITGEVTLDWNNLRDATIDYYMIYRNGTALTTVPSGPYVDMLPAFGTYDYEVQPIFLEGDGVPVGPETVYWYEPELCYDDYAENTQWPDQEQQVTIQLENCADDGVLWFEFPDYVTENRDLTGTYQVEMFDSFGDGWNGNSLDIYVDGAYAGTAELLSGSGPGYFDFTVTNGAEITGIWNWGSWSYECSYNILDTEGNVVYSGVAGDIPAGVLYAVVPANFVVAVEPATGTIMAGETLDVVLTYSSMGYPEGDYTQDIFIVTNEPDAPASREQTHTVENWMYVVQPEMISGLVTDCNTGAPIGNVSITAVYDTKDNNPPFMTETGEDGTYMLYVEPDYDYMVTAEKVGYQTGTAYVAWDELPAVVDFALCEEPYAVDWVFADPNEADNECMVTWSLPMGPYMISYDDGTAEDYFSWVSAGGQTAVKFTPAGYPATVEGGRIYVGEGDYAGHSFAVGVIDDDGAGGMPGTVVDSAVIVLGGDGWVNFDGLFDYTFEDGDFYIVMWQLEAAPAAPPVGVDLDVPTVYRSYVKASGGEWGASAYNDFMMRAIVSGPGDNVQALAPEQMIRPAKLSPELYVAGTRAIGRPGLQGTGTFSPVIVENADRDLATYQLYRIDGFDPDAGETPADGTHTLIEPALAVQMFNDLAFGALDPGFYAYGVTATYDNDDVSDITYSNIVAHGLDNVVTINVTQCDEGTPEGAFVELSGQNYPYQILTGVTDATGVIVFDSVIDGTYDLVVTKEGYMVYEHNNIWIYDDYTEDVVLQENPYPAKNMYVDALTSWATWEPPASVQVPEEGFEDAEFPPAGWTTETNGDGWFRTNNGSSTFWTIPPGDGYYACSNDDANSGNDGSMDYLITPPLDLRGTGDYYVSFSAYYDGAYGQSLYVEISVDGGENWTEIMDVPTSDSWEDYELSLADYAGYGGDTPVYIAFHSDDNGSWASGAAVDNIMVTDGHINLPIVGYQLYLDGGYVASVGPDVLEYQYQNLTYGQTYNACVVAEYACGLSEPTCYEFTSTYLYPPRNLTDEYVYNTNEVPLFWNPPMTVAGPMAMDPSNVVQHDFSTAEHVGADQLGILNDGTIEVGTTDWNASRDYMDCDEGSVFGTDPYDATNAYTSNENPYIVYQHVTGLAGSFNTVRFWFVYLPDAEPAVPTFNISIWEDGAEPGTLIAAYQAEVYGLNTGVSLLGLADIYQYTATIATTSETDFWISVTQVGATGSTSYWVNAPNYIGQVDNIKQWTGSGYADGTEPAALCLSQVGGGGGGVVPDGLLSFNVYRKGEFIANVPYDGEGTEDWIMYVDNNLAPACYNYDVTALYDLTDFGFPGEIGESAKEGPHEVCVVWGIDIPFCEDWTQGTFEFNGWEASGDNWEITNAVGNDAPSAQWNWDPDPGMDYSSTLTSAPFNADMFTEGHIWLDFDLALEDRNTTGDEMMSVEIYNGFDWVSVAEFDNGDGSFDFTPNHVEITDYAMSSVFMIRFNATGVNSFDVIKWNVDNICIYRTCDAPFNLTGEYLWNSGDEWGAMINWEAEAPTGGGGTEELIYDNGVATGAYSYQGYTMSTHMSPAGPCQVLELKYYTTIQAGDNSFNAQMFDWAGSQPGTTELFNQGMTAVDDDWVSLDISADNVEVDGDFMVGFGSINATTFLGYDANLDNGRSWDYDNAGGWAAWNEAYLIRAVVQYPDGRIAEIGAGIDDTQVTVTPGFSVSAHSKDYSDVMTVDPQENRSAGRTLDHFNVFRSPDGEDNYALIGTTAAEEGVTEYSYFDTDVDIATYCYKVTAVYMSDTDECESDYALTPDESQDFVCVFVTGIDNPLAAETVVYPNPARDQVTISSSEEMSRITVINYVGQMILDSKVNQGKVVVNTSDFDSGIYLVRIETESGVVTKRFAVAR